MHKSIATCGTEAKAPWGPRLSGVMVDDDIGIRRVIICITVIISIIVLTTTIIFPRQIEICNIGNDHMNSTVRGEKGISRSSFIPCKYNLKDRGKRCGENDHSHK